MADTTTTNYALVKPEVGASNDTWGDKTNGNWDALDAAVKGASNVANAALPKAGGTMTGPLVMNTGGAEQIALRGADVFISGSNAGGTVRWGFLDFNTTATYLASDAGAVALRTGGVDRLTISAAGVATFSNSIVVGDANLNLGIGGTNVDFNFDAGGDRLRFDRAANSLTFFVGGVSTIAFSSGGIIGAAGLNTSGNVTVGGTLAVTGALSSGARATFSATGEVARLISTDSAPFLTGFNAAGTTRLGYLQFGGGGGNDTALESDAGSILLITGGSTRMTIGAAGAATFGGAVAVNAGGLAVNAGGLGVNGATFLNNGLTVSAGGAAITGNSSVAGTLNVTGALTQAGNQVYHAGNFNPATKADLAGATFTGAFGRDASFYLDISAGKPRVVFDAGDYLEYDRTANKLTLYISGAAVFSIGATGIVKSANDIQGFTAP